MSAVDTLVWWTGAIVIGLAAISWVAVMTWAACEYALRRLGITIACAFAYEQLRAESRAIRTGNVDDLEHALRCCRGRVEAGQKARGVEPQGRTVEP